MDWGKIQYKKLFPILNCQIKLKILFLSIYQVWSNCLPNVDRVRLGKQNLRRVPDFTCAHIWHFEKEKKH